jgi:tetratricopeptide (TPR) repeat protein/MinD-like ATPase involved in chromosome partitioning or flagellar assembly
MSRIVTFYSYKGGVGRTFALANIGVLLARRDKRVLRVDWDLEAPGLHRYFKGTQWEAERGVIHILHEASANPEADWRKHIKEVSVADHNTPGLSYSVSVLPSGVAAPNYSERVRDFSWHKFFEQRQGGAILERWRAQWKREYDFVLIDSRTGITDAGGVCTILLPDFMVLVFTANEQSLEGAQAIAGSAQAGRRTLAVPRPPLLFLPLLSRFDSREELALSEQWLKRIAEDFRPLYADWLPSRFAAMSILELTKVPYVSRFGFGEPLPVLTHSLTNPELPGFYLDHVARLLLSDFRDAARIIEPDVPEPLDAAGRVHELIERAPIDEVELHQRLTQAEEELGEGPELAQLLNHVGLALKGQARFADAEPHYRRALAMNERHYGPEHPGVAVILHNLAALLHQTNRLVEAEPLMLRALSINENSLGSEHPDVAICLNNLARLLSATGRWVEAEVLMRRALAIDENGFGPEDPNVARDIINLAELLRNTDRLQEAEPLMRRALAINENSFGPEHPSVATGLNSLALLLRATDRLDEAEPLMRRALTIREKSFGQDHPIVAISLSNLALLLRATGRWAEAETLMRRALAIHEASLGLEHPDVAGDLNNLARLLHETDRLTEAESLMRRSLTIVLKFTRSIGHRHPKLLVAYGGYRRMLEELDMPAPAIQERLTEIGLAAGYDLEGFRQLQTQLEASAG